MFAEKTQYRLNDHNIEVELSSKLKFGFENEVNRSIDYLIQTLLQKCLKKSCNFFSKLLKVIFNTAGSGCLK